MEILFLTLQQCIHSSTHFEHSYSVIDAIVPISASDIFTCNHCERLPGV